MPTRRKILIGAIAGSTAVALSVILFSLVIGLGMPAHVSASAERSALLVLILSHIPLMIAEGAATGFLVAFLLRTRPQLLEGLS